MIDKEKLNFYMWFYVFGNGEDVLEIIDVYVFKCSFIKVECKGDILKDEGINICV